MPPRAPNSSVHFLRLGVASDWERLVREDRKIYPPDDCISAADYIQYTRDGMITYLMCKERAWVGVLQVWPPSRDRSSALSLPAWAKDTSYIAGISVFRRFQGRGYSRHLISYLDQQHGSSPLSARTRVENSIVAAILGRAQFKKKNVSLREGAPWQWWHRPPLRVRPFQEKLKS